MSRYVKSQKLGMCVYASNLILRFVLFCVSSFRLYDTCFYLYIYIYIIVFV